MNALGFIATEFNLQKGTFREVPLEELNLAPTDKHIVYWIHCNLHDLETFAMLKEKLALPDEVLNLRSQEDNMAKLLDMGDSLAIRIECLTGTKIDKGQQLPLDNLILYLTEKYCLTIARSALPALTKFPMMYHNALKYAQTSCFMLFLILDNVINDYSEILYDFDVIAGQVDLEISATHKNIYNEVVDIKNQVLESKRNMAGIRDILMRISGRKIPVISEQCRLSLLNLYNHCHMVVTEADAVRDILNSSLDKIDNALMQKMNESMKILTAFAAVFLPITLVASIYGMNFQWIPELQWKYGYFYALLLMVVIGGVLLYVFKKKKWF